MSRRKKAEGHANHERWLISYGDFVTLLFALFVVLFASSQVDHRKVGKLAQAIQVAFQQLGIFESSNSHMPLSQTQPMPFSDTQMVENETQTASL
ncbi:MAG TPA: flagellar motor protein MotB, partial [Terriglobia bacterium]|nr:flagellar motor protein MotB [Terriglobia bacterium]